MKYRVQWRDPDRYVVSHDCGLYELPEAECDMLLKMGARYYVVVEFDTETGVGTVVSPKPKEKR